MDTPITRAEHEEFRRRMEDEHKRMNHRLGLFRKKLSGRSGNRPHLCRVLPSPWSRWHKASRDRKPGWKNWKAEMAKCGSVVVGYVLTAVISITVGFVFSKIGM